MPFTQNDGVRLHWDEQGEGPPVLLVMGHRFSSAMWYPVIPALAEQRRVIWFDNRGTGQSDAPRHATLADLVGDALAVLDAAGVDQAHVYGVSMGGGIALELGISHPERVRSLVLGCTCAFTVDKPRAPKAAYLTYYVPFRLYAKRARTALYGTESDPAAVDRDLAMLAKDRFSPRGVIAQAKAIAGYSTTKEAVGAVDLPALVLHGTADTAVPYAWGEELAGWLPDARLVTFEGAGHSYFAGEADRANAEVLSFLAEVEARP